MAAFWCFAGPRECTCFHHCLHLCLCFLCASCHSRPAALAHTMAMLQAEEVHARLGRQSAELGEAIAAAKGREAEAAQQLRQAEAKLREAVQRDEK